MFLKKWKQYKQVKKIVGDIEDFEDKVKKVKDNISLKKCIEGLVDEYNRHNKYDIPDSIEAVIYDLAQAVRTGDIKKGTLKQKLALELIEAVLGVVGGLAKKLIWKALIKRL